MRSNHPHGTLVAHAHAPADDETPRQICEKLGGIDVRELLLLNKGRYKGLHANARLLHGTQLLMMCRGLLLPLYAQPDGAARTAA